MTNDQIHVVGVFGLGTMGAGMARSLLREGIETVVWDRSRGRSQPFAALGATVTANAEDAANQSDIAITMVADADAVLAVADEYKMLGALPANATWLQMRDRRRGRLRPYRPTRGRDAT
jgi:3-hydroxyisobutyrate dehydrogenase